MLFTFLSKFPFNKSGSLQLNVKINIVKKFLLNIIKHNTCCNYQKNTKNKNNEWEIKKSNANLGYSGLALSTPMSILQDANLGFHYLQYP